MRTRWRSRRKPARFISFTASEKGGQEVVVDAAYVRERMAPLTQKGDLSRFILQRTGRPARAGRPVRRTQMTGAEVVTAGISVGGCPGIKLPPLCRKACSS
jgi:hypothetical protein